MAFKVRELYNELGEVVEIIGDIMGELLDFQTSKNKISLKKQLNPTRKIYRRKKRWIQAVYGKPKISNKKMF